MKKILAILFLVLSINSYAVLPLENFSTSEIRVIVSNGITITRWAFTTIADLVSVYNKSECAVMTEQLELQDMISIISAISGTSNLVPFAPESRMIISVIPNTLEYNLDKVQGSKKECEENIGVGTIVPMRFGFVGDEVKEMSRR
jgi:hypothetical protein